MAKKCEITGKKAQSGHNVSHAQNKTKRKFKPNLQTKRLLNPATGEIMKVTLSAKALKTLQKWQAEGKQYDLRELVTK
ncbi:MAG: 50S ribosomal protein L28 [Patescibacteria group bacterium]